MKKNYIFTLFLTLLMSSFSFGQVIITELADPDDNSGARFVELYNAGNSAVDLTGWSLKRWTNGNSGISSNVVDLSAITNLSAGGFVLIAANGTAFTAAYNKTADIDAGTGGPADSNGDDQIALFNSSDIMVDIFGVPGEDGSNTCHEFENGRAERKASASTAQTTWNEAQWNVWADSSVSNCTSHTNLTRNVADNDFDPGAWIGTSTTPTISASSTVTNLDYFENNGPSAEKTFSVDGNNLTTDISITAPTNFEISTTSGSGFTSSVTLQQMAGVVATTTIYVRLIENLGVNTYSGDATITATGATDKMVALSGQVSPADPQISFTAFLDDFNYVISTGNPSAEQTFTVEGLFLTNDIIIVAPTNYEVSLTTSANFSAAVNVTPTSGTVAETTIYVRLKSGLTAGTYAGDITLSSTGVADQTIAVSGNAFGEPTNSMIITGVYDGSLTGGTPKGVELYILKDIADLSLFGVSSVTNGQGSTAGNVEFTFPAGAATAGTFVYVATEDTNFNTFFGMMPTYISGVVAINGDDSIELYESGQIIDVFGDVNTDGSDEAWDYLDGWAYRKANTGPEKNVFTEANWTYSGVNGLEGGTNNATATSPFPIGTYTNNNTASVRNNTIDGFSTYPNPVSNGKFTISAANAAKKEVSIFNILGKKVLTQNFSGTSKVIETNSLNKGIYILKVTEGNNVSTKKLVIR